MWRDLNSKQTTRSVHDSVQLSYRLANNEVRARLGTIISQTCKRGLCTTRYNYLTDLQTRSVHDSVQLSHRLANNEVRARLGTIISQTCKQRGLCTTRYNYLTDLQTTRSVHDSVQLSHRLTSKTREPLKRGP